MTIALSVQHLSKLYGSLKAVDDFSLEVPPGIIFGLLGPNGAGKTTLLKMLTTLATPTAGDAFIDGYSIRTDSRKVRELIGVVPQENNLDRYLTARENLVLHARMHGMRHADYTSRIDELLDLVGLASRQHDYPDIFSGGMQRRLVAARALVHFPRVLFLDEPTTGLDPQSRRALWDYIQSLKSTMTIFLTTHYMDEADALCDRIMIMDDGRALVDGTSDELKEALARSRIYEIEFREDPETYEKLMSSLPFVESLKRTRNTFRLSLRHEDDMTPLIEAVGTASLRKICLIEPSLEDVFIELTGKRIRD